MKRDKILKKKDLFTEYTGNTDRDFCDYLYGVLKRTDISPDGKSRNMTDKEILRVHDAMEKAHQGDRDGFFHALYEFFGGYTGYLYLPLTYTEKGMFIMLYETGISALNEAEHQGVTA